jgi:hypothetical protein
MDDAGNAEAGGRVFIQSDDKVFSYLRKLGYSEQRIAGMSMHTRLFHDLGAYGDSAIEDMQLLEEEFGVDLSGFEFAKYFPPEFEGRSRLGVFPHFLHSICEQTDPESEIIRAADTGDDRAGDAGRALGWAGRLTG